MSEDNVIRPDFNTKFVTNEKLASDIYKIICEYDKQISLAEVVGILEVVKTQILINHLDED